MRVHYLQHVSFEGLGYMEKWLLERGHTISCTRVWEGAGFPDLIDFDLLIILGGPMGVYDESIFSWLKAEKNFISSAIKSNKKIIGICLGAQIIAEVLGAEVRINNFKEIGWFGIQINSSFGEWLGETVPEELVVFHWHGDEFGIPLGAVSHATSEACAHQLFTYKENIIGIQFHPEVDEAAIKKMIEHEKAELIKDEFVQEEDVILNECNYFLASNELMGKILERMVGG